MTTLALLGSVTFFPDRGRVSPVHVLVECQSNNPDCKWGQLVRVLDDEDDKSGVGGSGRVIL